MLFFPIAPAEELVQVNNLEYGSLVPTANDTFRTTVSWQKPEFAHSDVKYYKYKLLPTDVSQRERRGTPLNTEITTVRIMNSIHYQIKIIFSVIGLGTEPLSGAREILYDNEPRDSYADLFVR